MLKTVALIATLFGSLNAVAAQPAEEVLLSNLNVRQGTWEKERNSRCAFGVNSEEIAGKLVAYFDFGMGITWTVFPDTLLEYNEGTHTITLKLDPTFANFVRLDFDPNSKKIMTFTFVFQPNEWVNPPAPRTCILKD